MNLNKLWRHPLISKFKKTSNKLSERDMVMGEVLREKKGYAGEFRFRRATGETRWVHTQTSPVFSADGRLAGHVTKPESSDTRPLPRSRARRAIRASTRALVDIR